MTPLQPSHDATPIRAAVVTNIPAPYRVPVFNLLALERDIALHVFYAARMEPDRKWDLPALAHSHTFLRENFITRRGRFIHNNPDVFAALRAFDPEVVITSGFNPTHLYAFAFARIFKRSHVAMTDGTLVSESRLSWPHRWARRIVLRRSRAFVAASEGGRALIQAYGVGRERICISPLCANTSVPWAGVPPCLPGVDFLFSGRLVNLKNPLFALRVAHGVAKKIGRRVRLAILGSGPLEAELHAQAALHRDHVELHLAGHVNQAEVPAWFASSRVFLFPTSWDPWGVVANEACIAGVPSIISPHAGAAGELIRDGVNGFIRPLDLAQWIDAASTLLLEPALHARYADQARLDVQRYSPESAASGIAAAIRMAAIRPKRVVCIQRRLTHYRVPLFEALRHRLANAGVQFELIYGDAAPSERAKKDEGQIAWATYVPNRYWFGERLCWQNALPMARGADMVIVAHENKLLFNMLAARLRRPKRLAFWGHGRNFQAGHPDSLRERFKRRTLGHADWWFAYTSLSRQVLEAEGFPHSRTTDLENAIDTATLVAQCAAVTPEQTREFRSRFGLGDGPVGLFVGSLYPGKRLGFLLKACDMVARAVPGFHLLVLGEGPQRKLVEAALKASPWLRYAGTKFGTEKAVALRSASVMLNPGIVGLGVLDAFAAGLPMMTTDCGIHSPEIAYLRNGENGLSTPNNLADYVGACVSLLQDETARARMGRAALKDAAHYTLENMVENFHTGILAALKVPPR